MEPLASATNGINTAAQLFARPNQGINNDYGTWKSLQQNVYGTAYLSAVPSPANLLVLLTVLLCGTKLDVNVAGLSSPLDVLCNRSRRTLFPTTKLGC